MKRNDLAAHLQKLEELEEVERIRDAPSSEQRVLDLQRTAGNRAANALVVQAKLIVGKADDPAEREADLRAGHVIAALSGRQDPTTARRSPDTPGGPDPLGGLDVNSELESEIDHKRRGSGQKIPSEVQRAFGADSGALDGVRVHTDVHADRLSESLQAKAFTTGQRHLLPRGHLQPRLE